MSDAVKRVGRHISCQCGSCSDDVNCMMSSGQCGFCKPARTKIWKMQQAGMSDQGIADEFIKEYGAKIYRADPNAFGWVVPYGTLALGSAGDCVVCPALLPPRTRRRDATTNG